MKLRVSLGLWSAALYTAIGVAPACGGVTNTGSDDTSDGKGGTGEGDAGSNEDGAPAPTGTGTVSPPPTGTGTVSPPPTGTSTVNPPPTGTEPPPPPPPPPGKSPFPCIGGKPLTDLGPSGWVLCAGGWIHRPKVAECPTMLPRAAACASPPAGYDAGVGSGQCRSDADCTAQPNGYCAEPSGMMGGDVAPGCWCNYGCTKDSDCGPGSACMCGNPVGQCVQAECTSDADCGPGLLCSSYIANPGCGGTAFACQTPDDTCAVDSDCAADGAQCTYANGRHECQSVGCAIGRPFLVDGAERLAAVVSRTDWTMPLGDTESLVTGLAPEVRAALAQRWTEIGLMEHASIAAFARFSLQLLALGAPPDLAEAAQAAMGDETRHAKIAFSLASAYSGRNVGPGALSLDGSLDETSLVAIVRGTVIEGCIGETVAAVEAAELALRAKDPTMRAMLEAIAADETRHAELAWRFVKWAMENASAADHAAIRSDMRAAIDRAIAEMSHSSQADNVALAEHGIAGPALRAEIRRRVLCEVVRPAMGDLAGAPRIANAA